MNTFVNTFCVARTVDDANTTSSVDSRIAIHIILFAAASPVNIELWVTVSQAPNQFLAIFLDRYVLCALYTISRRFVYIYLDMCRLNSFLYMVLTLRIYTFSLSGVDETPTDQLQLVQSANVTCNHESVKQCKNPFVLINKLRVFQNKTKLKVYEDKQLASSKLSGKSVEAKCRYLANVVQEASYLRSPIVHATEKEKESWKLRHKKDPRKHIYLILLVPPGWGSSALEGLLATSPHVSTMCDGLSRTWQCEGTWLLREKGVLKVYTRVLIQSQMICHYQKHNLYTQCINHLNINVCS